MDDDDDDPILTKAHKLAAERGYFDMPQSELCEQALQKAESYYEQAEVWRKICLAVFAPSPDRETTHAIMDHGEAAADRLDDLLIEYFASTMPLDAETRHRHTREVSERFPGFLTGGDWSA